MFGLAGKRVLVTGGGRGLGRAIALLFAERGAAVVVAARTGSELDGVAGEIRAAGGTAHARQVDLTDAQAGTDLVRWSAEQLGGLDILVNNAGGWGSVPGAVGPVIEATPAAYDFVFDLNVRTPLFTTLAAARVMAARGTGGVVLNMASVDGMFPAPGEALYGAAKAAVVNLTATLAYELGGDRIRVNALAPALVETELTAPWLTGPADRADRASLYPLNRFGVPADVAAAALYLCSDEAGWISGVTLPVNGGQQATSNAFRWPRAHNEVPDDRRI